MAKIKAIIFDLDGTLRDTKKIIYGAYNFTLLKHVGHAPTEEELLPHIHHHLEVHKTFAPDVEKEVFEATYFGKIEELLPSAAPYINAHETVNFFKGKGYKVAVVTTATFGANYLKRHNVHHLFDAIVGGNDTERHKPFPDPVLKAVDIMGIQPQEAIMIGDMTVDVKAAKSAKLTSVIGITHGFETREMLQKAGADYIVDSFDELPKIINKINSNES